MEKKYEGVIRHIENLVETRQLLQGQRLPSIRDLAEQLCCNKATIIRAYDELVANHKVFTIPKSGYYLVEQTISDKAQVTLIDFFEAIPDPKLLPFKEFNHCISKAVEIHKDSLFLCTETQGMASLRAVLAEHFKENQVFASEIEIFITSGSQQTLSLLAGMPFPNGKRTILIEQPSYSLMQEMLKLNGITVAGIKRGFDGVNMKELEQYFQQGDIKFFYTMPRFQNPLGTSYTEKDKKRIVELAQKYDVYIVEDDYFVDIESNNRVLPLHYYDVSGHVIYVRSYSKTFMPGIRIGTGVIPEKLRHEFLRHKRCQDLSTSVLAQGALEIFISSGMYKNHLRKIRKAYHGKMACMRECLKPLITAGVEYAVLHTGFFIWIRLPETIDIIELEKRLKERQVRIRIGQDFYDTLEPDENSIRIAFSNLPLDKIRLGMLIVVEEIQGLLQEKRDCF